MKIITRAVAIRNLRKHIGADLRKLALEHKITTFETGKQNKGWKGLVLERLAGLKTNVSKAPNGLTYELKSVAFKRKGEIIVPKETMAITMVSPEDLRNHSFFESHCWAKLKTLVFCAVLWTGANDQKAELLQVTSLDYSETDEIILEIKKDYDLIRKKFLTKGFKSLRSTDGKWLQTRTKGPGHGSVSRAFYARSSLVAKIFETSK